MKKAYTLALTAFLFATLCGQAQIVYVAPNATGNGTSFRTGAVGR